MIRIEMEIEIRLPEKVVVLGVDSRSLENLAWCAATYGINRLFWVDGHLLCTEVYEKSFEHEMEKGEFCISQVCYSECPEYRRIYEVEKGTEIPVVNASDMRIYRDLLKAVLKAERS
jgi:hypothetical protein